MMSNKFNDVGKNKLLKGLLVALPFVSLTPESEAAIPKKKVTVSRPTTRMAKGTQSTGEYTQRARAVKRAEARKARFQRVRAVKKAESGKVSLQRASAAKKVEPGKARFQRARVVKKVEPGKAELQRPIIKKRMRATGVRRTFAPRNTQRTATVVSNRSYIRRLEAKVDQTLELFKKSSLSFTPPMSKAFDAIASSITKLGEMFDVLKKKEEQKIEKRLAKKAINKVVESEKNIEGKETTGNRINMAQKLPLLEQGVAIKNSAPVVSGTPEIAKEPANPLEAAAQLLGFELNKDYKDGEEAIKVLGQKFYAKKKPLDGKLEKEGDDPEKFVKFQHEIADLESQREILNAHLSTKFNVAQESPLSKQKRGSIAKNSGLAIPKAPPLPEGLAIPKAPPLPRTPGLSKALKAAKGPAENAGASTSKAPLPPTSAVAVVGTVDLSKTLLENLLQVDDAFVKKAQLTSLLNEGEVSGNKLAELFEIENELLRSVNLSVKAVDTQIDEISNKLANNTSGKKKDYRACDFKDSLNRPSPQIYWDAWDVEAKDLFNQKINLTSQLIQKESSLMLLVQTDQLDRMVALKANKNDIESRGNEILTFIKNLRDKTTKVSGEVLGKEKAALLSMNKVLQVTQKKLEESVDVFGARAKKPVASKFRTPRIGGGRGDLLSELNGRPKID